APLTIPAGVGVRRHCGASRDGGGSPFRGAWTGALCPQPRAVAALEHRVSAARAAVDLAGVSGDEGLVAAGAALDALGRGAGGADVEPAQPDPPQGLVDGPVDDPGGRPGQAVQEDGRARARVPAGAATAPRPGDL